MIAGPFVVDASVVVDYLVRLEHWEAASRVFAATVDGDAELWAPDLVYCECPSALRRLVRTRAIDARSGARAAGWLAELPIVTTGTGGSAADIWALRDALTPYDAAYAVLARRLDAPLITADTGLARAVSRRRGRAISLASISDGSG